MVEPYTHDAHGNMTAMPHLSLMLWDFKDQLQATARQVVNEGMPETTWYVYDATGQRVRKVTERQNGTRKSERTYLGGFEVFRAYDGDGNSVTLERETLHLMDDKQRIALVETRTQGNEPGVPQQLIRYQFGNHLGSASLELDVQGRIISYEEYYPYGSTSYQAGRSAAEVSLKRYRYTGMERDEESGFNYHGARYYAASLGRWISCDPKMLLPRSNPSKAAFLPDDFNPYLFVLNNPLGYTDPDGEAPVKIGDVYVISGTINGEQVVYSGSTAQELKARFSKHKWKELIQDPNTTVFRAEVKAEPNVALSNRKTRLSAQNEALRAAEQVVIKRRRSDTIRAAAGEPQERLVPGKELNILNAAEEENVAKWGSRHNVRIGPTAKLTGIVLKVDAVSSIISLYIAWKEFESPKYRSAPMEFEDEYGIYNLYKDEDNSGEFGGMYGGQTFGGSQYRYYKSYETGLYQGTKVEIVHSEFSELIKEHEALYGTVDGNGDFTPGLLRPRLPTIYVDPLESFRPRKPGPT